MKTVADGLSPATGTGMVGLEPYLPGSAPMLRSCRCLLVLLSALITLPAGAGELYRWKDADGKLHFTDTPPPAGAEIVTMESRAISVVETVPSPAGKRSSSAPLSDVVQRELDWQRGIRTGPELQQQRREAAAESAQESRCAKLKARLKRMDSTTRVSVHDTLALEEAYSEAGCR